MQYLLVFMTGILTFVSPCILPMLPTYLFYFAGEKNAKKSTFNVFLNVLFFVIGYSIVFILLGVFASAASKFLFSYKTILNIIAGSIVIIFGLNYLGLLKLNFLYRMKSNNSEIKIDGFFSALLFGMVFAFTWTPCVGAYLSAALALAANKGTVTEGIIMLLLYSLGLGIPFLISAVLLKKLTTVFTFIKKHYQVINIISGVFLILFGILVATSQMDKLLGMLNL